MSALGILVGCIIPIGLTKHVSDKRPETDADILEGQVEIFIELVQLQQVAFLALKANKSVPDLAS